jgi:hypothetical protein
LLYADASEPKIAQFFLIRFVIKFCAPFFYTRL